MTPAVSPSASSANQLPRNATVLCVDDSPEMLLICKTILEAGGFAVFTASDGISALETLRTHTVNAAVIDNCMPGMTGIELAREIKKCHNGVPILMFSDSGPEPCCKGIIDVFLNKESGPRAMRDAVKSLLEQNIQSR